MLNFCTLFDSFYLTRGVALYQSLENTTENFHLYIFAFDNKSFDVLTKLKLKKATIISLKDFEDEHLLALKPSRTKAEYCWTCTPSTVLYVIEKFNVPSCTYLDADLYFFKNPNVLFEEMGNKSILITEHRYPPNFNRTALSGIYCVQFTTFVNDENGLKALTWWRNACNEWCYNRYEDGKFGDQKYLDDWTTRFEGVHVLEHLGGGLALWNIEQYELIKRNGNQIDFIEPATNKKFEAIFFHFHHVRFFKNDILDLGWREPKLKIVHQLFLPYIDILNEVEKYVKSIDNTFDVPLENFALINNKGLKNKIKYLIKVVFRYSVYDIKKLRQQHKKYLS
jgi:hypothetical protein